MISIVLASIAAILFVSPIKAALPDESIVTQSLWSSWLVVILFAGALVAIVAEWGESNRRRKSQVRIRSLSPKSRAVYKQDYGPADSTYSSSKLHKRKNVTGSASHQRSAKGNIDVNASSMIRRKCSDPAYSYLLVLVIAAFSLIYRLLEQHSIAYLGLMLTGWSLLASNYVMFILCRKLSSRNNTGLLILLLSIVTSSVIVACIGLNEYLTHSREGERTWRVFGTSTPDFLAGYLLMLLPITAAILIIVWYRPRRSVIMCILWALILAIQLATMLATGSRFAIVSLLISLVVLLLAAYRVVSSSASINFVLTLRSILLLVIFVAAVICVGGVFARPVLERFLHVPDNSGAFRMWTWIGAERMAIKNPLVGTGIGAWVDLYPRYALTGFTRMAHNSYLQLADECGIPALVIMVYTIGLIIRRSYRSIFQTNVMTGFNNNSSAATFAIKILLCGILASIVGAIMQNIIDSDLYVFFLGMLFWAICGIATGLTDHPIADARTIPQYRLFPLGALVSLMLAAAITKATAASYEVQAQYERDPLRIQLNSAMAETWDPLSAEYAANIGYRVDAAQGNFGAAEQSLKSAVRLEPSGVNYRKLGSVLENDHKPDKALLEYKRGLTTDPNSIDLLLAIARLSPNPSAREAYRQIADLEQSPVGTARALGDIVEVRFAIGDSAVADDAFTAKNWNESIMYYSRAERLLEDYADENGTLDPQRQILIGYRPDPIYDQEISELYTHVMDRLMTEVSLNNRSSYEARSRRYSLRFDWIISKGAANLGDDALSEGNYVDARAYFGRSVQLIESVVDQAQHIHNVLQPDVQINALICDTYVQATEGMERSMSGTSRYDLKQRISVYKERIRTLN